MTQNDTISKQVLGMVTDVFRKHNVPNDELVSVAHAVCMDIVALTNTSCTRLSGHNVQTFLDGQRTAMGRPCTRSFSGVLDVLRETSKTGINPDTGKAIAYDHAKEKQTKRESVEQMVNSWLTTKKIITTLDQATLVNNYLTSQLAAEQKLIDAYMVGNHVDQLFNQQLELKHHSDLKVHTFESGGDTFVLMRDYGLTSSGEPCLGRWAIRNFNTGECVDVDQHRYDLLERNNIKPIENLS